MKLEDQVCSLDLAKKLKELRVKQESHWHWTFLPTRNEHVLLAFEIGTNAQISAFTVAELGELLPWTLNEDDVANDLDIWKDGDKFTVDYGRLVFSARTEADARSKMLIHLIERGLVKP